MADCSPKRFMRGWLLTFILLVSGSLFPAPADGGRQEAGFFFVQITDTHIGERDHLERTRKLVDRINRLPFPIACVVHTGDIFADNITDADLVAAGLGELRRLKAPLHLLPGNHDILAGTREETAAAYAQRVGPLIHAALYHDVAFIFAYTEPLALGFAVKGYDPVEEIRAALKSFPGKPILFFHHRPAVEDYYEYAGAQAWSPAGRTALAELLRARNVAALITGHFHRDELHWLDGIPVFAAPPVAGFWGRQASFRLYAYREGKISYRTLYLAD
ncbi:MAG: metallophosphoesterase [Desulfobacterales bacterium]|jgi:UDP-2,3-diacylglucosamine pyrophosphatase LpxH|nr:metallophosphoesterase [Desulfobacterales bacterium]